MSNSDVSGSARRKRRRIEPIRQEVILKPELDLFSPKAIQTAIVNTVWTDVQPIGSITESSPIVFNIPGSEEEFVDPGIYIKLDVRIKNANGTALSADSDVSTVNCFAHSLFKRIDMKLQDKIISTSTDNYPYRAYIERLLNFSGEAKKSQLTAEHFFQDTAGKLDVLDLTANYGLKQRHDMSNLSQPFTLFTKLSTDIGNQPRLLINNVDILITLHHSSNPFRFMFGESSMAPKLELINAQLFVRRLKVSPPMASAIAETLRLQPAHYPISRVVVKTFQISGGISVINKENLSMGQIPRAVVIGVVDSDAYIGSGQKSPFNFQSKGVEYVSLYLDSEQIPTVPFTPKWSERDAVREYLSLFQVAGLYGSNTGNNLSYEDYLAGGYVLFGFDLTPDESAACSHAIPSRHGNLSLKMQFGIGAIDKACTVVAYMVYDNRLYIDHNRNILTDYA